jgi:hypothetical protein
VFSSRAFINRYILATYTIAIQPGTTNAYENDEGVIMKIIPFSPIMEFQRESQRAVRGAGLAESAVWAVFAASAAISMLLSLSQITPASAQSAAPKASAVVSVRPNVEPSCAVQNS